MGTCTIQPGACETVGVRAIFIAPTKAQNVLHFTVQLGLSQSGCKKVYEFIVAWEF